MKLTINGDIYETAGAGTIPELLAELNIDSGRVAAVEVNLSIIRKSEFASFKLNEGDMIEIVNFVGGG